MALVRHGGAPACRNVATTQEFAMKVILWIVAIIFLIGLAVVIGTGKLLF
jgi:hypothetical protein